VNSNEETVRKMLEALHKLRDKETRVVGAGADGKTALVVLLPVECTPETVHAMLEGLALDTARALEIMGLSEKVESTTIVSVGLREGRTDPPEN
jgi:hypothetical protein